MLSIAFSLHGFKLSLVWREHSKSQTFGSWNAFIGSDSLLFGGSIALLFGGSIFTVIELWQSDRKESIVFDSILLFSSVS